LIILRSNTPQHDIYQVDQCFASHERMQSKEIKFVLSGEDDRHSNGSCDVL